MEVHILLKGKKDPIVFMGDRIDILDIEMKGEKYTQVRCFKKGFSKSQYISNKVINKIKQLKRHENK